MWFGDRRRNKVAFPNDSQSSRRATPDKLLTSKTCVFVGRRLRMERLEDRCVLSVATVNTEFDVIDLSDGLMSLREAVLFSNALIGHDKIQFDPALHGGTIVLSLGELTITDSLEISGPGADLLRI